MQTATPDRVLVDGRPYWRWADGTILPVLHGGDGPPGGDDDADDDHPDDDADDAPEGDAADGDEDPRLKQARAEAVQRRRDLKPWRAIGKDFGMTPEQVRDALSKVKPSKQGDDAPDAETVQRDADRKAQQKADARIIRAEVKAIAAGMFTDPADAPLYLNLDDFEVDEDGNVDEAEIKDALKKVLDEKPHLARSRNPKPDTAQGARDKGKPSVQAGRDMFDDRHAARKGDKD